MSHVSTQSHSSAETVSSARSRKTRSSKRDSPARKQFRHTRKKLKAKLESADRMTNTLAAVCKNSTHCIALGKNRTLFNRVFDHFSNWTYVDDDHIRAIGNKSRNGFILNIPFQVKGYTAHTVLKTAISSRSDNLTYEYLVGKRFINAYCDIYPCFVETYSLMTYKHKGLLYSMKTRIAPELPAFPPMSFSSMMTAISSVDWRHACTASDLNSILIQYFDNVQTFEELIQSPQHAHHRDVFQILYQIYFVLDALKSNYTHYDLHSRNVLLYKPFPGNTYIRMHYHQPDKTIVSIQSEWIVKIIDYGRNFFQTESDSSNRIIDEILATRECDESMSVNLHKGHHRRTLTAYIDPTLSNPSHDLQLTRSIPLFFKKHNIRITNQERREFGFPYMPSDSDLDDMTVNNVSDMHRILKTPRIRQQIEANEFVRYNAWECGGDMHIFSDGRPYTMTFRVLSDKTVPLSNPKPTLPDRTPVRLCPTKIQENIKHMHLPHPMSHYITILLYICLQESQYAGNNKYMMVINTYVLLYVLEKIKLQKESELMTHMNLLVDGLNRLVSPPPDGKPCSHPITLRIQRLIYNVQFEVLPEHQELLLDPTEETYGTIPALAEKLVIPFFREI